MMDIKSKFLDEILNCPDVEWLELGKVGTVIRGNGLQKKDFLEEGFPAIHYGQLHTIFGLSADKSHTYISDGLANKLRKANTNDLLIVTTSEDDNSVARPLAWFGKEVAISGDMMMFKHSENVKFLAYIFQSDNFTNQKNRYVTGTKVRRISKDNLEKILIPIPSLYIQQKIVDILDTFTTLTAELTAELTARKQQYEYYRDELLTFGDDVEWKELNEIILPTSNIRWQDTDSTYRYIDLSSVSRDNKKIIETTHIDAKNAPSRAQRIVEEGDVIFATTRPTLQRYTLIDSEFSGDIVSTGYCVLRAVTDIVLPKWIYYHIASTNFNFYVEEHQSGSAYPAISDKKVKDFKIPVPSLDEQARVIEVLDKFDTLTNSITEGLPKEIELRQKQYEYYRDLLLSFPKPNED